MNCPVCGTANYACKPDNDVPVLDAEILGFDVNQKADDQSDENKAQAPTANKGRAPRADKATAPRAAVTTRSARTAGRSRTDLGETDE